MAKGGGSANKSLLFQETKALLNPDSLMRWLDEKLRTLGTAACPPYHLALVIGGTSAEQSLKTAKLASARYLDTLPNSGNELGRGFRDLELEQQVLEAHAAVRHRRAVRRQVLLPRRARDPPAAPRRVVPGRAGGLLLRRPPVARQDHRRRRVPRTARDRSRRSTCPRSPTSTSPTRSSSHRPQPADVGDPRHAVALSGEDARDAHRADGRRARHRARQAQGAPRRRRGAAAVHARLLRVLRGTGEDPRRLRVRIVRSDHRRAHGLLRRPVPAPTAARS